MDQRHLSVSGLCLLLLCVSLPTAYSTSLVGLGSIHGTYIGADEDGILTAASESRSGWETFILEPNSDRTVAFKSAHGKYVVADESGNMGASSDAVSGWESFSIVTNDDGTVAIRSIHGTYVSASPDGDVSATSTEVSGWESFSVEQDFDDIHGVNYGVRFVPEKFFGLSGMDDVLFKDVNAAGKTVALCDLGTDDAQSRMSQYLDTNIQEEHFTQIASLGFNTVRLPLGYWNLIDLPAGATPSCSDAHSSRYQNLQNIMPSGSYMKWIDMIFQYADSAGLKVMLDFHGAPGGQSGNMNTGCDLGGDEVTYWDTEWNKELSVQSISAMARICADKGSTCWGLELLNEPYGPNGAGISRDSLKGFYGDAIRAARQHIDAWVPIIIYDWPDWINSYWKQNAQDFNSWGEFGKIVFSTHLYQWDDTHDLESAMRLFDGNFNDIREFTSLTGFELVITEYAFNSHGSADDDDDFDYHGLAKFFVEKCLEVGRGSMIWNYDAYYKAWGPVAAASRVGQNAVDWNSIFSASCDSGYGSSTCASGTYGYSE